MLTNIAHGYSELFAPELFVLFCSLFLIGYEWNTLSSRSLTGLGARVGVLMVGWVVAFTIYQGVPQIVGPVPDWGEDATGSVGLAVGMLVLWLSWRLQSWGPLFPEFALLLVAVTIPHLLITPLWDISSHVLYAAVPAGYLALLDCRFMPLCLIAVGMVAARPLAGAHTWLQSVAGMLLATVVLIAFERLRASNRQTSDTWRSLS